MYRKSYLLFVVLMIAALALSACGQQATTVAPKATDAPKPTAVPPTAVAIPTNTPGPVSKVNLPEVDPSTIEGTIIAAGSSTVYPLLEALAKLFEEEGFDGKYTIDSIGSGAGFERFCKNGETDISNASRGIKSSEVDNCKAIGRTPIEFRVGTDAIAMVVSKDNEFLTAVTIEELAKIFSSDAVKWSDVNPAWPNEDIRRFSPGTDSGTFDFFVEFVMQPVFGKEEAKAKLLNAANAQFSEDDNVLVQGVEGSPYAIGYFGYAYYVENAGLLKVLSINSVAPSFDTAESGEYPLSRPLFIYSDARIMQSKPAVAAFINFVLTNVNLVVEEVGYFPASVDAIDGAKQAWLDAMNIFAGPVLPYVDPADYDGTIIAAGSSTVFPLLEAIAKLFEEEGFAGKYTIDSIGSGAGFERFCKNGETDISNASRGIKDSEKDNCTAIGRTPIEFKIGIDAIAMVVSADNDFLTDVTKEELAKIFSSDAVKWSDVNPAWPNEDIRRFAPGTDSGTFDFFVEFVMQPVFGKDEAKAKILNAANAQFSEDDNVLVQGVEGSPYAIGFFGFAYYFENQGALKALSIGGVAPNKETAESGEYPLSRPLFIYSDANVMKSKPQVAAFINFVLSNVNLVIDDVGYFPASLADLDASRQAWLDAMK